MSGEFSTLDDNDAVFASSMDLPSLDLSASEMARANSALELVAPPSRAKARAKRQAAAELEDERSDADSATLLPAMQPLRNELVPEVADLLPDRHSGSIADNQEFAMGFELVAPTDWATRDDASVAQSTELTLAPLASNRSVVTHDSNHGDDVSKFEGGQSAEFLLFETSNDAFLPLETNNDAFLPSTSPSEFDTSGQNVVARTAPEDSLVRHDLIPQHSVNGSDGSTQSVANDPRAAAYQVAYRLIGDREMSTAIAAHAVEAASTKPAQSRVAVAADVAVTAALQVNPAQVAKSSHAQHRTRLRRDLARHNARDRSILALRNLVGCTPERISGLLGTEVDAVRKVSVHWNPGDFTNDDQVMLKGIDNWITSQEDVPEAPPLGSELAHLDDSQPPAFLSSNTN